VDEAVGGALDGPVRPELAEGELRAYSELELTGILDARNFVESRTSAGGTATARRRELAAAAAGDLAGQRRAVEAAIAGVARARARLLHDAEALVSGNLPLPDHDPR
jgi:argininosuccinate lyase